MGFPFVAQLARLERIRELKGGKQEVETVWLITSLSAEKAGAAKLLQLARQYWTIENGTHQRLDGAGEDRCKVRHPVAASALGILRRAVQGEYQAWAKNKKPKRHSTCPAFLEKLSRRLNSVIRFLTEPNFRL